MTTLAFPSVVFPGRPTLALDVPDGWQSVPAAGEGVNVVLAALRPLPDDVFAPNIVVTLDELFPEHSVRHDLDGVATTAAHRRDGSVGEVYTRTIGGLTFFARDLSYVDDLAGTLLVSNLFGFLRRAVDGGYLWVTVTATIGSVDHRADYDTVHALVNGLRITPRPGTVPLIVDSDDDEASA